MQRGKIIQALSNGEVIAKASLNGVAAVMGEIDQRQKRAGTTTALTMIGSALPTTIPKPPPLPVVIQAPAFKHAKPLQAPDKAWMLAQQQNFCPESTIKDMTMLQHWLDVTHSLVILTCHDGSYNARSQFFVAKAGTTPVVAQFDYLLQEPTSGVPMLPNVIWNATFRMLSSFTKGRGPGDCGHSESYVSILRTELRSNGQESYPPCRVKKTSIPVWIALWIFYRPSWKKWAF